ncbi:hypothetical protein BURPS1655_H0094 [Burkholderia pseudomallei 1655]|nr:hypothetical protein BURPS1655_H0094 [Burkholderia pseudomallei 1655]
MYRLARAEPSSPRSGAAAADARRAPHGTRKRMSQSRKAAASAAHPRRYAPAPSSASASASAAHRCE